MGYRLGALAIWSIPSTSEAGGVSSWVSGGVGMRVKYASGIRNCVEAVKVSLQCGLYKNGEV